MILQIENRKTIEKIAQNPFLSDIAVISICDFGCSFAEMIYKPDYLLCVQFDDVGEEIFEDILGRKPTPHLKQTNIGEIMTNRYNLQLDNCDLEKALNDGDFIALAQELFEDCGYQFLSNTKMSVEHIISYVNDYHLYNATKSILLKIALEIYNHQRIYVNDFVEYLDEMVVAATLTFVKRHSKQMRYP